MTCCAAHMHGFDVTTHQSTVQWWCAWSEVDTDAMIPVSPLNATDTHVEVVTLADRTFAKDGMLYVG